MSRDQIHMLVNVAGLVTRPTFVTTGLLLSSIAGSRPSFLAMASSSFHGRKGASLEEGGVIPDVLDSFTPQLDIKCVYL